jgi:hypothetical protein
MHLHALERRRSASAAPEYEALEQPLHLRVSEQSMLELVERGRCAGQRAADALAGNEYVAGQSARQHSQDGSDVWGVGNANETIERDMKLFGRQRDSPSLRSFASRGSPGLCAPSAGFGFGFSAAAWGPGFGGCAAGWGFSAG